VQEPPQHQTEEYQDEASVQSAAVKDGASQSQSMNGGQTDNVSFIVGAFKNGGGFWIGRSCKVLPGGDNAVCPLCPSQVTAKTTQGGVSAVEPRFVAGQKRDRERERERDRERERERGRAGERVLRTTTCSSARDGTISTIGQGFTHPYYEAGSTPQQ
jgi:hypothetical protein